MVRHTYQKNNGEPVDMITQRADLLYWSAGRHSGFFIRWETLARGGFHSIPSTRLLLLEVGRHDRKCVGRGEESRITDRSHICSVVHLKLRRCKVSDGVIER